MLTKQPKYAQFSPSCDRKAQPVLVQSSQTQQTKHIHGSKQGISLSVPPPPTHTNIKGSTLRHELILHLLKIPLEV